MKSQEGQKSKEELTAIDKIRKLREFSIENGATESEIENAIKLAQRLMMKHNLEEKDLELDSKDINVSIIKSSWKDGMEARSFEGQLLRMLSNIYSCQIINHRSKYTNTDVYKVVGLPEDRNTVETIYESVLPQIRNLTKKRYKESDKSLSQFKFTTSYQTGFLSGLTQKIKSDRETYLSLDSEKEEFGLVVVKKEALVKEWVETNLNIKTSKVKQGELSTSAFFKGLEDGSEKGLNQQLGS